ncbi:MAG: mucoidy inhibitor MuiA family protein [Bacteroidota bacterium]
MKKLSFVGIFLLPLILFGQQPNTQIVKSDIKQVKLFLTSGEMTHQQSIKVLKGRNKLIFPGISAFADPQSIQFTSGSKYKLVSVSTEMDFLAAEQFNPRIAVLKDSLEVLKDQYQANEDQIGAFNAEVDVMNANKKLGGQTQNLTVAQIKEAADFYRTRTLEINRQLSKLRKEQTKLSLGIENTRYQLVELNYNENQRSNQVIILIDVEEATSMETTLKYLVSDCGWAAMYDLSAAEINQKINLKYKAQVYNNTGSSWNNVELLLSTADPLLSASHPILSPWYLSYHDNNNYKGKNAYYAPQVVQQDYRAWAQSNIDIANKRAYDNYMMDKDVSKFNAQLIDGVMPSQQLTNVGPVNFKQIEISELMAEFAIPNKFSCPSDSKPYMVDVKEMNLDATFSHITVPKLDNAAFLLAHIVGWQELELIPGPTNVYFGGVYVGMSQIDTRNVSDTLSLSFGRDNKVLVMRKLKQEMSSKKVIGGSKKESYSYEIAVRNNRNVPIKIRVYDQVPISQNSDITVTVDNISGAKQDAQTGEVTWDYVVEPSVVKSMEIAYSVKYPKDANITMQRFKTVSCPAF